MAPEGAASGGNKVVVRVNPLLAELVPGFLENRRQDVETMRQILARGDFETLKRLGHRLKGDGGGYGFSAISEFGQRLEDAARSESPEAIQTVVEAFADYLANVEVVYPKSH